MAHAKFAMVTPEDYPDLRRLLPRDAPETFEGWEHKVHRDRALFEGCEGAHTTQLVMIKPADFERYCREHEGNSPSLAALNHFVRSLPVPSRPAAPVLPGSI